MIFTKGAFYTDDMVKQLTAAGKARWLHSPDLIAVLEDNKEHWFVMEVSTEIPHHISWRLMASFDVPGVKHA
jgi:hypothetical protein